MTRRHRLSLRRTAATPRRTSLSILRLWATLALAAGAATIALPATAVAARGGARPTRRCGSFRHHVPARYGLAGVWYRIDVTADGVGCPTAERLIRDLWSGKGVHHGGTTDAGSWWTIPGFRGWRCGQGAGAGGCTRRRSRASYEVTIIQRPRHPARARRPATSPSPYDRSCGTSRDGALTTNLQWKVIGPWHIAMSFSTARSIALRVGPSEFAPPGSHPAPRDVPCTVAQAVASSAADAWTRWRGDAGWVGVTWVGYARGPYIGRFHCTGATSAGRVTHESCNHVADRNAGAITVRFVIRPVRG